MASDPTSVRCSWCGADVPQEDGYRAREQPGARRAAFCRLEHVVPWAMQGARWDAGDAQEPPVADEPQECARCAEPLTDARITLMRHRGQHRIPDAFCSVDHLAAWSNSGGRYGRKP